MKKIFPILFFFLFLSTTYSQTTHLDFGVNRVYTSFILRNGMGDNLSRGYGANFTISKPTSSYRSTTQYIHYKTLDMDPTWKNVSAYKIETNVEIVTHFENIELLFYPFLGLSYNYISGIYTGKNDPDALKRFYITNAVVTNKWLGLTGGLGLERKFKNITIFANYRMHIVKAEEAVRIMDIGLDIGLKYGIDIKKINLKKKKDTSTDTQTRFSKKAKRSKKSIFRRLRMPHERYDLK